MAVDPVAFSEFERRAHDRIAGSYARLFTPITALALPALLDAAGVGPGRRVLDVASGPGLAAASAARRGAKAIGTDISGGMVELARQAYPGVEFRQVPVTALPFPDGAFDSVICNFALGHFPAPREALAECLRVLLPGGRLAMSWWDQPARQRIQGLFREAIAALGVAAPPEVPQGHDTLQFSDAARFLALLRDAGLEDAAVSEHRTTHLLPDADAIWEVGIGSMAVTAAAATAQDAATQALLRDHIAHTAEAYRTPQGLAVPIAFLIGAGRKPG